MSASPEEQPVTLSLPSHTVKQLDELVRRGYFHDRQEAVIAAVERLHTAKISQRKTRQQTFTRLCGALSVGTTRHSLRQAALDGFQELLALIMVSVMRQHRWRCQG